jgi:branched-chain amino acid transport system substrate-binding protein
VRYAACLVACLLLSSCAFPGSVKPTVKIGLSAPFEGLYRDLGYEVLYATRLAVQEQNAAGGVAGRYLVELVSLNDFNEPAEAVLQAHEMAADPGVLGVLGGWSAETALQAAPEYGRLGLPFLAPEGDPSALGAEAARFAAQQLGARRAVILSSGNAGDEALADAFAVALAAQGGTVIREGSGQVPPAGQADLFFIAADAPLAAEWIVQARAAGFDGPFGGSPGLGSPLLVEIGGEAVERVFYVSPFPSLQDDPAFRGGYQSLSGGAPPGPVAGWAYRAAGRLLDALDAAARGGGDLDREAVGAALVGVPGEGLGAYVYVVRAAELFQQP